MEMDDKDFSLVRKNLNILSVLILILAYTNAQLHSLNLLGIQLELNEFKLYIALYIGYMYFIWRFLTKLPLRSGFWNDFSVHYLTSDNGVKKEHNFERYKDKLISQSTGLKSAIDNNDPYLRLVQASIVRFDPAEFRKLRLSLNFHVTPKSPEQLLPNLTIDHDIIVSRFFFAKCLLIFCVKYDKFGDYLFPILPIVLILCFFLFKSGWQGSLPSLLK